MFSSHTPRFERHSNQQTDHFVAEEFVPQQWTIRKGDCVRWIKLDVVSISFDLLLGEEKEEPQGFSDQR